MYKIIQSKDSDGSDFRVIFNSNAINQAKEVKADQLLVFVIANDKLGEEDSWDEIEEGLIAQVDNLDKGIFISRIVRSRLSELYFYTTKKLDLEELKKSKLKWVQDIFLSDDEDYFVFDEMDKSNFLSSEEITEITEFPTLMKLWKENEIDISNEFYIMFPFYSTEKEATDKFVEVLKGNEYHVQSKSKRTLLIFKGYVTHAEKNQHWDTQKLTKEYLWVMLNSKKYSNRSEGILARK